MATWKTYDVGYVNFIGNRPSNNGNLERLATSTEHQVPLEPGRGYTSIGYGPIVRPSGKPGNLELLYSGSKLSTLFEPTGPQFTWQPGKRATSVMSNLLASGLRTMVTWKGLQLQLNIRFHLNLEGVKHQSALDRSSGCRTSPETWNYSMAEAS